ncbi:lipopolysaccharide 1,2-glucosyltransferase, partial [Salmonella enterica subsp. enterica serovar Montevideo]|nr:lipopolysaccharide 1,2-glucosyltransferase [Salmonella enterica subsp. enterica serovar Montevideo]
MFYPKPAAWLYAAYPLVYAYKMLHSNIINDNTILIHYTGATKPWHAWANYPSVIYYKNARLNSPW